ncbi:hypothetical protein AB4Y44_10045 [Paraburkholderia sp. BR10937]|uniref:hypothetical protein n=1 Tax=Paraburkholderia sp. BR10937 TaxID=3236994 RepID=UPI0034D17E5C
MKARAYAGVTLLCLTACANDNRPQVINGVIADSPYVAATADMRFVFARPKPSQAASSAVGALSKASPPDWADPNYTICAEPSPDIAKALADAFTASANVTANGLKALGGSGANVSVNPAFSSVQNSSLAELGRRLATTQLLRDGVYRLCEAYSNGAISATEYALVLSRYGDTMVTLLAIEAVTGMSNNQQPASAAAAASAPPGQKTDAGGGTPGGKPPTAAGASFKNPDSTIDTQREAAIKRINFAFDDRAFPAALKVADKPPSGTAGASHATPSVAASAANENGADADKVAMANAVITIQENYLKQSAYAPLITLCAKTLTANGTQKSPENSMEKDCTDVLHEYILVQSSRLSSETDAIKKGSTDKPASEVAAAKTAGKR